MVNKKWFSEYSLTQLEHMPNAITPFCIMKSNMLQGKYSYLFEVFICTLHEIISVYNDQQLFKIKCSYFNVHTLFTYVHSVCSTLLKLVSQESINNFLTIKNAIVHHHRIFLSNKTRLLKSTLQFDQKSPSKGVLSNLTPIYCFVSLCKG